MRRLTAAASAAIVALLATPLTQARSSASIRVDLQTDKALAAEARTWVTLLSAGKRLPPTERLLVLDADGVTVATVTGAESKVALPAEFTQLLQNPPRRFTLVHNHPNNTSVSGADLAQLARPAVARIAVLGHDGSVYEASAGPRYQQRVVYGETYTRLLNRISARVDNERRRANVQVRGMDHLVTHLAALSLRRAGILTYRAHLTERDAELLDQAEWFVDEVIRLETQYLEDALTALTLRAPATP